MTMIPILPTIFDNKYSGSRELNCISSQPIIPRLMVKQKRSMSVWKHIWGILRMIDNINGFSGYP
jgi:hypothetical protein